MRTIILILLLSFAVIGCGTRDTSKGPAGTRIGQTVAEIDDTFPAKAERVEQLADGREARTYSWSHWSLWTGSLGGADHPTFYFRDGKMESWKE